MLGSMAPVMRIKTRHSLPHRAYPMPIELRQAELAIICIIRFVSIRSRVSVCWCLLCVWFLDAGIARGKEASVADGEGCAS